MRRRERWRNLAWLQWMDGDLGAGAIRPNTAPPMLSRESLAGLVGSYGRYVEMERDGDSYRVRVLPRLADPAPDQINFGMSYAGDSLLDLLANALVECDLIAGAHVAYRIGASEKVRWLP